MNPLRFLAERFSRRVVVRRRLPAAFGGVRIYVSPGSQLRYWKLNLGKAEQMLFAAVDRLVAPGEVVWDVGANVGVFTFAASVRSGSRGRVVAFEPDLWLSSILERSAFSFPGRFASVDVLTLAVAGETGVAEFAIARRGRASNFLKETGGAVPSGGIRKTKRVLTMDLDSLSEFMEPPKVLKIDIEGAELMALRGGETVLKRARPKILCEVQKRNCQAVAAVLRRQGYLFFDAESSAGENKPLETPAGNIIALPEELCDHH